MTTAAWDIELLDTLNGCHTPFADSLMLTLTSGLTWIPLYLALVYLVIKNNETMLQIMLLIVAVALCVAITAGVNELVVKPMMARPRPSLDPLVCHTLTLVDNVRGSGYSFFSSHVANTFGIALLMSLVVRSGVLALFLVGWALLNAYTRLYLGVHYPTDIAAGIIFGAVVATAVYLAYMWLYLKVSPRLNYISTRYTASGYALSDVGIVITVLVLTLLYAVIRATII